MAAKPREPTPEEARELKALEEKLIKEGKIKAPEGKHRKTGG